MQRVASDHCCRGSACSALMPATTTYLWNRRWLPIAPEADKLVLSYEIDQTGYVNLYYTSLGPEPEWLGLGLAELTSQQRCVVLLGELGMGMARSAPG